MKKKFNSPDIITPSTLKKEDNSPIIPQRSKIKYNLTIHKRNDLTEKQKELLSLATSKETKIIFVVGPAGTAKTFCAIQAALELINSKRVSDLIYVRSAVESSDSKLGFLPGEANEKMAPYIQPLLDKLSEFLSKGDIDMLNKEERIIGMPVGYLRGLSFNAKVIINDEAQNMTEKEIFTLLTRIGKFSKLFILGDLEQSDINGRSGLNAMVSCYDNEESRVNGIHVFRFTEDDIVREDVIQFLIQKYRKMKLDSKK